MVFCTEHSSPVPLQWRHNDHDRVSNHQPHGCLLNRLFRRISKKTSKLRVTGLCVGNSPGPVNSPHKGPATRKMFPFDDVIMLCAKVQSDWTTEMNNMKKRDFERFDFEICFRIFLTLHESVALLSSSLCRNEDHFVQNNHYLFVGFHRPPMDIYRWFEIPRLSWNVLLMGYNIRHGQKNTKSKQKQQTLLKNVLMGLMKSRYGSEMKVGIVRLSRCSGSPYDVFGIFQFSTALARPFHALSSMTPSGHGKSLILVEVCALRVFLVPQWYQ